MNDLAELENKLGYIFRRRRLLSQALTHPSRRNEVAPENEDNQRLEFLGDAALGFAAADYLYRFFPSKDEGWMTVKRTQVTSARALADLARDLELGDYLLLGKGEEMSGGCSRDSNLADAMEAIFGAAYRDGGFKAVKTIFNKHLHPILDSGCTNERDQNPKGVLQEWCQRKMRRNPEYRCISIEGPAHARRYLMEVHVTDELSARAEADSKRDAERLAAIQVLDAIADLDNDQI